MRLQPMSSKSEASSATLPKENIVKIKFTKTLSASLLVASTAMSAAGVLQIVPDAAAILGASPVTTRYIARSLNELGAPVYSGIRAFKQLTRPGGHHA